MGKIVIVGAAEVVVAVSVGVLVGVPAVVVVAASAAASDLSFSDRGTAPAASVQPARNKRPNLPSFPHRNQPVSCLFFWIDVTTKLARHSLLSG